MQVLKDDLKKKIISAASEEFRVHGYKESSMRSIAAKAGITAGNIYRYFENKESLLQAIIDPCIREIERTIAECTDGKVDTDFDSDEHINGAVLNLNMKLFSRELVQIGEKYPDAMQFIARDETYHSKYRVWLTSVLFVYYSQHCTGQSTAYNRIVASIGADTLIDTVICTLKYASQCRENQIDLSSILYRCLNAVIPTEVQI